MMYAPGRKSSPMQTGASKTAAVQAMFTGLIDYAGLFPPAQLTMPQAVSEYAAERRGSQAWMLGRFIVPYSRYRELLETLAHTQQIALSVILDGGIEALAQVANVRNSDRRARIEMLEIVLEPNRIDEFVQSAKDTGLADLPAYVEFAREGDWERLLEQALPRLAAAGLGAKVRCGGAQPAAFPAPSQLAAFIDLACRNGVPFKATAGLHHPIRHFDATIGASMNGFLNLLAAAALARSGATREELVDVLACEDPAAFAFDESGFRFRDRRVGALDIEAMRSRAFVSYGSCSFSEPVEDLRALQSAVIHKTEPASWVDVPAGSDFPLANLPYGVFTAHGHAHIGIAIGKSIFDVCSAAHAGLFEGAASAGHPAGARAQSAARSGPHNVEGRARAGDGVAERGYKFARRYQSRFAARAARRRANDHAAARRGLRRFLLLDRARDQPWQDL